MKVVIYSGEAETPLIRISDGAGSVEKEKKTIAI